MNKKSGFYEGKADIFSLLYDLPDKPRCLLGTIIKAIAINKDTIKKHYQIDKNWLFDGFGLDAYETEEQELRKQFDEAAEWLKRARFNLSIQEEIIEDFMLLGYHWKPSKKYFEIAINPRFIYRLLQILDETFKGIYFEVSEKEK